MNNQIIALCLPIINQGMAFWSIYNNSRSMTRFALNDLLSEIIRSTLAIKVD